MGVPYTGTVATTSDPTAVKQSIAAKLAAVESPNTESKSYTALDAAKDVLMGTAEYVPDNTRDMRLAVCMRCEYHMTLIPFTAGNCTKCGCFVGVKTKFAAASCPLGKWMAAVDVNS
jgi:ribosomal protein L40E